MEDQRSRKLIMLQYGSSGFNLAPNLQSRLGTMRDISFENISVTGNFADSALTNFSPPELAAEESEGNVIDNVRFLNMTINGTPILSEADLKLERHGPQLGSVVFQLDGGAEPSA
jgi:hypothetical protein